MEKMKILAISIRIWVPPVSLSRLLNAHRPTITLKEILEVTCGLYKLPKYKHVTSSEKEKSALLDCHDYFASYKT